MTIDDLINACRIAARAAVTNEVGDSLANGVNVKLSWHEGRFKLSVTIPRDGWHPDEIEWSGEDLEDVGRRVLRDVSAATMEHVAREAANAA